MEAIKERSLVNYQDCLRLLENVNYGDTIPCGNLIYIHRIQLEDDGHLPFPRNKNKKQMDDFDECEYDVMKFPAGKFRCDEN